MGVHGGTERDQDVDEKVKKAVVDVQLNSEKSLFYLPGMLSNR